MTFGEKSVVRPAGGKLVGIVFPPPPKPGGGIPPDPSPPDPDPPPLPPPEPVPPPERPPFPLPSDLRPGPLGPLEPRSELLVPESPVGPPLEELLPVSMDDPPLDDVPVLDCELVLPVLDCELVVLLLNELLFMLDDTDEIMTEDELLLLRTITQFSGGAAGSM